ncbi:hypothetical protein TWF694_010090 [Orbilia ellipsospora]|uniref:C2H2-type domain-containing protein n=1 Tax=Orbilia ellipsospora TaxID=2528407 RepID=A0AAV9X8U5_9PEZI
MAPYCHRCQRSFVHTRAYNAHIANSSSHNFCFVCGEDIKYLVDLVEHEKDEHDACHECKREFIGPSQLDAHLRSGLHAGKEHACICNEDFVSPAAVLLHIEGGGCPCFSGHELMHLISIRTRRNKKRRYYPGGNVCIEKDNSFMTSPAHAFYEEYPDHENIAFHRKYRNYVCQYCLARFSSSKALNQHLSTAPKNDGRVWYICDGCDRNPKSNQQYKFGHK